MKKILVGALCSAVVAAAAAPALADHQIGGYYRTTFIMENLTKQKDTAAKPDTVVDNRLRARWQNNINEYVSVVWFGEVDAIWGMQSKGSIGNGGKQGNDGVNVETKHAFLDVKIPSTPVSTRIGLQPLGDNSFGGIVMNDDAAGITFGAKTDMVSGTLGWFKFDEGTTKTAEDDSDMYFLQASVTPMPGLKLTPELWWAENKGSYGYPITIPGDVFTDDEDVDHLFAFDSVSATNTSMYYLGLGAAYKVGIVDLSGWFLYQWGTIDGAVVTFKNDLNGDKDFSDTVDGLAETQKFNDKVDVSAWAISAKAAAEVAGAKLGLRLMYFPEQSDKNDLTYVTPPNNNNGAFEFYDEGLGIFLADVFYMNTAGGRLALTDAAYAGYGLLGAVLNCSFTPPALKQLTVKGAVGYFQANDDKPDLVVEKQGTTLGTELALSVGYKVAEKVDVILRGNYAMLGDFYDKTAKGGEDPDNLYKLALTVNVPY